MNTAQHAGLSKIVKNLAKELDEFNSWLNHAVVEDYDELEEQYFTLNNAWFELDKWLNEQGVNDAH